MRCSHYWMPWPKKQTCWIVACCVIFFRHRSPSKKRINLKQNIPHSIFHYLSYARKCIQHKIVVQCLWTGYARNLSPGLRSYFTVGYCLCTLMVSRLCIFFVMCLDGIHSLFSMGKNKELCFSHTLWSRHHFYLRN